MYLLDKVVKNEKKVLIAQQFHYYYLPQIDFPYSKFIAFEGVSSRRSFCCQN